jgi:peptidoglycan/xylan/chitin deacetylase (PgdA/CDA1 family)
MSLGIILHHFVGTGHPMIQGALSAEDLDRFLIQVGRDNILDPGDWIAAREAGRLLPNQYCLTFDDALRSQIDIALPVVEAHGIKAFFFVYSSIFEGKVEEFEVYRYFKNLYYSHVHDFYPEFYDHVGRVTGRDDIAFQIRRQDACSWLSQYPFYTLEDRQFRFVRDRLLSKDEYDATMASVMASHGVTVADLAGGIWMDDESVRRLVAGGHVIGLHSHTHPTNMDLLHPDHQKDEYDRNIRHLTSLLGHKPDTMAHPSGSYSQDTLDILRYFGIRIGFRSDASVGGGSLLELPRLDYKLIPEWRGDSATANVDRDKAEAWTRQISARTS